MEFFFRHLSRILLSQLKRPWWVILMLSPIASAVICYLSGHNTADVIVMTIAIFIGVVVLEVSMAVVTVAGNFRINSALNKYGFTPEYRRIFEQERIIGQPFYEDNAVLYAEIITNTGQPAEALNYLASIRISDSNLFAQTARFYISVIAALKLRDISLAERIWAQNQDFLNKYGNSTDYAANSHLLWLAMIYVDCAAGRYDRALTQTQLFMNSKNYKKSDAVHIDYELILMYELKMLGREEYAAQAQKVRGMIDKVRPLFDFQKPRMMEDYNKILNGMPPF